MLQKNVIRWVMVEDANGKPRRAAIPHDCGCGERSTYGRSGGWFCTLCWIKLHTSTTGAEHETDGAAGDLRSA